MAGGVNKVILVGHLGADPDMRYTPSGQGVCELRVATSESWNDKNGQKQERTEWCSVVLFGKRGFLGLLDGAAQLLALGIMSLQAKRYFEELFHLGSSIFRRLAPSEDERGSEAR